MKNSRIKVVHVITTIERGGAENAVLALSKEQVRNGYEVVVVPLKGVLELENEFILAGASVDASLLGHAFSSQIIMFRKKYNESFLFHGHLPRAELLLRLCKSRSSFFITRHNVEPFFPGAPSFVSRLLSRFVTNRSKSVVAISNAVLQFLNSSKEISRNTQSLVIYYGYSRKCKDKRKQNQESGLSDSTLRMGTISRLTPQKNLNMLIQLGAQLKAMNRTFLIQIVGAGTDKSLLESKVKEIGLENEILFLGKQRDVMPFLQEQDVFVLTSNYEGFGLVLLEAMDANLPVIASRNSAIPEVLGECHPGLFNAGDSESLLKTLICALQTSSTYEEIMRIQSAQLDFFSMEKYFFTHHELYTQSKTKV